MAIIGNIVIGVRMSPKGLKKGLKETRGMLNNLGSGIAKVTGMIAGIGAAAGVAVAAAKFGQMAMEQAENVKQSTMMAQRIGTTTKALTGLQHAAKSALGTSDVEGFGDALSDMQEKIGDVTLEDGGAKDIMEMMGLDAESMASQDAEENFLQIADAIAGMQNQTEKLHVADTMFGGEGQKMLPLLEKGRKGIQEMQKEAEKMGLTFTEMEAGQVMKVQAAIKNLTSQFEGLANQVVIQTAPYITALIDEFEQLGITGINSTQSVSEGLGWVADGAGIVVDVVDVIYDSFLFLQSGLTKIFAWIADSMIPLAQGLDMFNKHVRGVESHWGDTAKAVSEDLHKLSGDQWGGAMESFTDQTSSEKIDDFFQRIQKGADEARDSVFELPKAMDKVSASTVTLAKSIEELEKSMKEQVETFGMSGSEIDVWRLKQEGATDSQLVGITKMQNKLKELEASQKLQEDADSLIDSLASPEDKYRDRISELTRMLNTEGADGETLIDFDQFKKAAALAKEEIFGASDDSPRFASLSEFGSVDARNDIMRHQFGNKTNPDKVQKDQLKEQQKQTQSLKVIEKNVTLPAVASFPFP